VNNFRFAIIRPGLGRLRFSDSARPIAEHIDDFDRQPYSVRVVCQRPERFGRLRHRTDPVPGTRISSHLGAISRLQTELEEPVNDHFGCLFAFRTVELR
jgi:hypothetical protein